MTRWRGPFAEEDTGCALSALEQGRVLYFPDLGFQPGSEAGAIYATTATETRSKNISYDPASGRLKGIRAGSGERAALGAMMAAFSAAASGFVRDLLPRYRDALELGRVSYRPVEIVGRDYSPLKDDKRLHLDAFPSTPMQGRRILRLFCNVNPLNKPRVWHIGEAFERHAGRYLPQLPEPSPLAAWLLAAIGATRGRRRAYDQLMLGLHDHAKRDAAYQSGADYTEAVFPAGSSWLCFTDQVVHAALAGQYALEHTFYVPVAAMAEPERSPLRVLERMTGRKLA